MKHYTKIRQFYAWIGFITLLMIIPTIVFILSVYVF